MKWTVSERDGKLIIANDVGEEWDWNNSIMGAFSWVILHGRKGDTVTLIATLPINGVDMESRVAPTRSTRRPTPIRNRTRRAKRPT